MANDVAEPKQKVKLAYSAIGFEAGWYARFLPKPSPTCVFRPPLEAYQINSSVAWMKQ